jgi:hypothetical protein
MAAIGKIPNLSLEGILLRWESLNRLSSIWMIPNKTNNNDHKAIVKAVISAFAEKLVLDDKIDYQIQHDFLQTYTYFVLN